MLKRRGFLAALGAAVAGLAVDTSGLGLLASPAPAPGAAPVLGWLDEGGAFHLQPRVPGEFRAVLMAQEKVICEMPQYNGVIRDLKDPFEEYE